MTYDVEVLTDAGGWATDTTTGSRHHALGRAQEMTDRGQVVRVRDRHGRDVPQLRRRGAAR